MTAAMFANAGMLIPGTVTLKSDAQLTLGNFNYMEGTEKLGVDGTDLNGKQRPVGTMECR